MVYDAVAERRAAWRLGLSQGFDEAVALVQDLPPQASVADALKVLALHREVWQRVAGTSADVPANLPASLVEQRPEREG